MSQMLKEDRQGKIATETLIDRFSESSTDSRCLILKRSL